MFIIGLNPPLVWGRVGCTGSDVGWLPPNKFIPKLFSTFGCTGWATTGVEGTPKSKPKFTGWETGVTGWGELIPKPIKSAPKPRLFAWGCCTGFTGWVIGVETVPKPKRSPPKPVLVCGVWVTGCEIWGVPSYKPKMLNGSLFWGLGTGGGFTLCSNENPFKAVLKISLPWFCCFSGALVVTLGV